MMQQRRVHKSVTILSLMLGVTLLSGCGQLASLPEKERYQRINDVLDTLDYETAGDITTSRQDRGDGVFSQSFVRVEYKDNDVFEVLDNRLRAEPNIVCDQTFETQIACKAGQVDVLVMRESNDSTKIFLQVTDRYNGREAK